MISLRISTVVFLISLATIASAQTTTLATSESRDASIAYIGVANFVVGRVGRDCLTLLGRSESPKDFVAVWQQRNAKYLQASQKYMDARLNEAEASGGVGQRNAIIDALTKSVRGVAESTVKSWLNQADKSEACKRSMAIIESGAYDFSPSSPMYAELESLATWAQQ